MRKEVLEAVNNISVKLQQVAIKDDDPDAWESFHIARSWQEKLNKKERTYER